MISRRETFKRAAAAVVVIVEGAHSVANAQPPQLRRAKAQKKEIDEVHVHSTYTVYTHAHTYTS